MIFFVALRTLLCEFRKKMYLYLSFSIKSSILYKGHRIPDNRLEEKESNQFLQRHYFHCNFALCHKKDDVWWWIDYLFCFFHSNENNLFIFVLTLISHKLTFVANDKNFISTFSNLRTRYVKRNTNFLVFIYKIN